MARRILIAGCGDLGCAVAERLLASRLQSPPDQASATSVFEIHGLRYSARPLPAGVQPIRADVTDASTLTVLNSLQPDILLYCVAASAQSDDNYRAHYVDGLRNVLNAIVHDSLQQVLFVSSTRVYGQQTAGQQATGQQTTGQQTDSLLDETTPAEPADFGGVRLLEAERLLAALPCAATVLRLSGIYGPGRTRMLRLAADPALWPAQNSWTNRIHRDDAAAFIVHLIHQVLAQQPLADRYVVTDNAPVSQYEVLGWIAGQLGVDVAGQAVPPVTGGKRLSNRRMRDTGFVLQYPDYQHGYASLLARGQSI
ncbi:NAD-dependent epimerase/dehydratase family protein [Pseudomethylobacillus aquaticus]|uniref:NAD-dependent epimerase/dehydratase family protein n=1 Tax=Pseudomethylobacillus aquaticus TaxID=2676064 RepID=A0A3N0V132_9PROT|nr:NAD-dependent epimerase/dehydratase family protein [Pseudomethylobacillus aquaticus]ROH86188.1 NAD-dependent epimerase/dehydratase family protein [Pseudomethylobacillus aquaticus]